MRSLGRHLFRAVGALTCASILLLSFPMHVAVAAELRVLRSDEFVLEIEWRMDEPELESVTTLAGPARRPRVEGGVYVAEAGAPDVPSVLRLVGMPTASPPSVQVVAVETGELPLGDMAPAPRQVVGPAEDGGSGPREIRAARVAEGSGVLPGAWAEFEGVSTIRSQRVSRLTLHPCRYDSSRRTLVWARSMRLRITFPPADPSRRGPVAMQHADWEGLMRATLLNADAARGWRLSTAPVARGTETSFRSSANWVRFPIEATGVYRLDYFTFANLGVDPANVDPRTIRVFAGTNLPLRESLLTAPAPFMTECALKDLGDGDGVFDLDDRFLVWAHSPFGFASEFDPARSRLDYIENEYGDTSYYWLTWESPGSAGSFASVPRRMGTRSVVDSTFVGPGPFPESTPHRLHFEENNAENFAYPAEDGWMWEDLRGRGRDRSYPLVVPQPASGDGIVRARVYSHPAESRTRRKVEVKLQGQVTATWEWTHTAFAAMQDVTGCFDGLLIDGRNTFQLNADFDDDITIDHVHTGWFDVEYDRSLAAIGGRYLHFFADSDSLRLPTAPAGSTPCTALPDDLVYGRSAFRVSGFDAPPEEIHLFDVTNQHDVVDLTEFRLMNPTAPYDIRFSDPGLSGVRWYVATTLDGVRSLPSGEFAQIRGLRDPVQNEATYLVIYHPDFEAGAQRLAQVRALGQYTTLAVSTDDVYQEFSWGMRDPVAIRNFLAVAQTWQLSPLYVVLVGDAVFDTKHNLSGSPVDYLSTYTRRYRETTLQYVSGELVDFYSTDDFFAYLDAEDYTPTSQPGLDVAIGRMPVSSSEELDTLIDKVESYLANETPGQWQNRVILVADDERVLQEGPREKFHTQQVEALAQFRLPPALDRVKIYLVDYPRNDFGKKPEAQRAFIDEFSRGALMVTYTGHGDQNTMAQEEVFVSPKVVELLNEKRYTIFSTFSCQVSRFDLLSGSSMTELLVFLPEGGAVTTFASGGLVYPSPSATLNQEWLGAMYGTPYVIPTFTRTPRPIGLAALAAKVTVAGPDRSTRVNNEKYVLLGDPALVVRFGDSLVDFESATVDSLVVDERLRVIRGTVRDDRGRALDGTLGTAPFSGSAWVHVTEDADTTGYPFTWPGGAEDHIDFTLEGSNVYRGLVAVTNGRFEARFYLNEGVRSGNNGRISVFALEDGGQERDASGAYESLVLAPTISPSQVNDTQGPQVVIRFEGYDQFVDGDLIFTDRPILVVDVDDPSGVNLRPFPQFARLEAELDGRERVDLAEDFSFLEGSFTKGKVRRALSMAPGRHTIQVKAFDNVGNRGAAEVSFTIVLPEADFDLVDRVVTPYPNPFRERVDIVFQLTHEADVRLRIFTLTGRRIYEAPSFAAAPGSNSISWTGVDDNGSPLANGTYLFKLVATRTGGPEGGPSSDEFVGKIVRMR